MTRMATTGGHDPAQAGTDGADAAVEIARLERANAELARANARLAREKIAHHDSAASVYVGRADRRVLDLEAVVAERDREIAELRRRLAREIEAAKRNDEYFQAARAKLHERHHRVAEGLHRRLARLRPGRKASG